MEGLFPAVPRGVGGGGKMRLSCQILFEKKSFKKHSAPTKV